MATPRITSLSPIIAANNVDTQVAVSGELFESPVTVEFGFPGSLSEIAGAVVTGSNLIVFDIPANMMPGSYTLQITNVGGEVTTLDDAFRIIYPPPAFPFTEYTHDTISNRVLEGLNIQGFDTQPGTFIYEIVRSMTYELGGAYTRLADAINQFYPQTARAGFLDRIGESFGLLRNAPQYATGNVRVFGSAGTVIPSGTLFSTEVSLGESSPPIFFVATQDKQISAVSVDVPVQARIPGVSGNVSANQITRMYDFISGATSVTNPNEMLGGTSGESDTNYRVRLLNFVQNPLGGGNVGDYNLWASTNPDVRDVNVVPLNRGNGTVDIYISGIDVPYSIVDENDFGQLQLTFFDSVFNDTDYIDIGGTSYTFRAALAGNRAALIEANITQSLRNMVDCINADSNSRGMKHNNTVADANVEAFLIGKRTLLLRSKSATTNPDVMLGTAGSVNNNAFDEYPEPTGTTHSLSDATGYTATIPASVVTDVQNYIDPTGAGGIGQAPIGADVVIYAATMFEIDIAATLVIQSSYNANDVRNSLIERLTEYINRLPLGEDLVYVKIANIIHDTPGITNYSAFTVNGGTTDVVVAASEKSILFRTTLA